MTFAIIKTGGKQYKVSPGQKIQIEKLNVEEGKNVVFDKVLFVAAKNSGGTRTDTEIKIGQPLVKGAKVEGKVLKQGRAEKVIVFKYKAKKRYAVKKGYRQPFSLVEVTKIVV